MIEIDFKLNNSEIEKSKKIYGKVIKCLISPYHLPNDFKNTNYKHEKNRSVYIFPEHKLRFEQTKNVISEIMKTKSDDILIITSNVNIIMDMIDCCVRILNRDNTISYCTKKTYGANYYDIHDIMFNNRIGIPNKAYSDIKEYITYIESTESINSKEYEDGVSFCDIIGDEIISHKLRGILIKKLKHEEEKYV